MKSVTHNLASDTIYHFYTQNEGCLGTLDQIHRH
jgi:hypothetical protein